MRTLVFAVLFVALAASPLLAQDPAAKARVLEFTQHGYPVRVKAPAGWKPMIDEPVPDRSWVRLAQFQEPRTGAMIVLSAQAAAYKSTDEMISSLKDHFQKDSTKAILRTEVREGSSKRPKSIFFEYTYKGARGPEHAMRSYWYYNGRRYRIYGASAEMKWRPVSAQIEAFIKSFAFTARIFTGQSQNFTDDAMNYSIYFPDGYRVRLPARGPRVTFASAKVGVMVLLYVEDVSGELSDEIGRLAKRIQEESSGAVDAVDQEAPQTHPALGFKTARLEYTRREGGETYKHRETVTVHGGKLYRVVLRGAAAGFARGVEEYGRIVSTLSFLR